MTQPNILVFGESGQLARELADQRSGLTFMGSRRLDLAASPDEAGNLIRRLAPGAVINAAAYTAVDKAESEPEKAYVLNARAPAAMAEACAAIGVPFVHVSTDYVFDGEGDRPYRETDPTAPQSVYGASKLEGEERVLAAGGRVAIMRTSWVFSRYGANFIKTMLRLGAGRDEVAVVADQHGSPTWAVDIAAACLGLVQIMSPEDARSIGLIHFSGAGSCVWADLAEAVFACAADPVVRATTVRRITAAEYPTPARRPKNSQLDCTRIQSEFGVQLRPWREGVALCVGQIEADAAA